MIEVPDEQSKKQVLADNLRNSLTDAVGKSPDKEADIYNTSRKSGLDPELVVADAIEAKKIAALNEIDVSDVVEFSPETARFLQNGNRANMAYDNLTALQGLEGWLKGVGKTYAASDEMTKLQKQFGEQFDKSDEIDPELMDKLAVAQERKAVSYKTGGIGDLVMASADILPSTLSTMGAGLATGGAAALGGIAIGAAEGAIKTPGPAQAKAIGAGTMAAVRAGQAFGPAFTAGSVLDSYRQNYGNMAFEMSQLTDASGKQIDKNVVRAWSRLSAAGIAGMDVFGLDKVLDGVPNAKQIVAKLTGKKAMEAMIQNPTALKAFQKWATRWGTAVATETGTEAAQELVQILGVNAGLDMSNKDLGTEFQKIGVADAAERIGDTAVQTAQGMALLGLGGATSGAIADSRIVAASKAQAKQVQEIADIAKNDKLLQRAPDAAVEFIEQATAEQGIKNAYIDAKQFQSYFEAKGISPQGVAEQLGVASQLEEAVRLDAPLVVPIGKFYQHIAPSEHMGALAKDITFSADGMTVRQLAELGETQKQEAELAINTVADAKAPDITEADKIAKDIESKAIKAGARGAVARANAKAVKSFLTTLSERTGVSVKELYEANKLDIKKGIDPLRVQEGALGQDINSDAFKQWFGDSKVVDDSGKPLVVYHGTDRDFNAFDVKRTGETTDVGIVGDAVYLSTNKQTAQMYARDTGKTMALYASLKNPEIVEAGKFSNGNRISDYFPNGLNDKKAASKLNKYLKKQGYDGVIFKQDGNIVQVAAFEPTQIKSVDNQGTFDTNNPNIYRQGRRGAILPEKDGNFLVELFQEADDSTLLHELGHYFHFVFNKYAQSEKADATLKADYAKTLEWLGVKDQSELTREHYEKFATGWETYLFEGKSPSKSVANIFKLFKNWLLKVYQDVKNVVYKDKDGKVTRPEITPEIRGIFDRMLATQEEIDNFSQMTANKALFKSAEEAGMTKAQYENYLKLNKTTIEDAKDDVIASAMRTIGGERKKAYRAIKSDIREQVSQEADKLPVYVAIKYIRTGVLDVITRKRGEAVAVNEVAVDGTEDSRRLNRKAVERYLAKNPDRVIPDSLLANDGISPTELAELVGLPSGIALLEYLGTYPDKATWIEQETAMRTATVFDTQLLTEESIREGALDAINNESRFEAIAVELKALERLSKQKAVSPAALKEKAKAYVRKQTVRSLSYKKYETAAIRAGNRAASLVAKKDWVKALEAKRQQMANTYIYKEIQQVQEEIDKGLKTIKKISEGSRLTTLTKASADGQGYLEAVKSLRQTFGFAPEDSGQYQPITQFIQQRIETDPIVISDFVAMQRQPIEYKDLTVNNFFELRDAFENIYNVAKISLDYMQGMEGVSQDEVAEKVIASLLENHKAKFKKFASLEEASPEEASIFKSPKQFFNSSLRIDEFKFMSLDGNRKDFTNGAAYRYIYTTIKRAKDEYLTRNQKATQDLQKLFSVYTQEELNEEVFVDGLGGISKRQALALLLNAGNSENFNAVLEGYKGKFETEFGQEQYLKFLNSLDKKDYDFAQSVWDYIDTYWPEVKSANTKRTGVELEKVEATPVETKYGTYRGGYYPLAFDKELDVAVSQRSEASDLKEYNSKGLAIPMTRKGHRIARVGSGGKPVNLDISVLFTHIDNVIKDLTMYDAVRAVDRLINRKDVAQSLATATGNVRFVQETRDWINSSIFDAPVKLEHSWINRFRNNNSIVQMGMAFSTAISQTLGVATTIDEVGVKYTADAFQWLYNGDAKARRAFILDSSPTIRYRFETANRDIRDKLRELKGKTQLEQVQQHFFIMTQMMDKEVASLTWVAGYLKATKELNLTDKDAVDYADGVVRQTQGSGLPENMSALMRSSEPLTRLWTAFQSFFNVLYNRFYRLGERSISGQLSVGETMMSLALLWWIPAALGELIVGRGPKEDEEFWKWLARTQITYPLAVLPIVGPIAVTSINTMFDRRFGGGMTAIDQYAKVAADTAQATKTIWEDGINAESAQKLFRTSLYLAGHTIGLPARQLDITSSAIIDAAQGEDVELRDLFFRSQKQ